MLSEAFSKGPQGGLLGSPSSWRTTRVGLLASVVRCRRAMKLPVIGPLTPQRRTLLRQFSEADPKASRASCCLRCRTAAIGLAPPASRWLLLGLLLQLGLLLRLVSPAPSASCWVAPIGR